MKARSRSSEGERGGCVSGASAQPLLLTEAKGSSSTPGRNSDRTGLPEERLIDNRLSAHPALPPHTAERRAGRGPVQLCPRQVQLRGGGREPHKDTALQGTPASQARASRMFTLW